METKFTGFVRKHSTVLYLSIPKDEAVAAEIREGDKVTITINKAD